MININRMKRRILSAINLYLSTNGMTGQQLSQLSGVHPNSITNYLCGHTLPTLVNACRLADVMGISLDELTGREKNDSNA